MKLLLFALVPLLASAATPPEIGALIASARAISGEFSADALIRIAALDSVEQERRVDLLTLAFDRATSAQQPYRRVAGVTRIAGPVAAVNKAYSQELDALSLRLRAVEGMLSLDPVKARELF